jgi:hypothetical protein
MLRGLAWTGLDYMLVFKGNQNLCLAVCGCVEIQPCWGGSAFADSDMPMFSKYMRIYTSSTSACTCIVWCGRGMMMVVVLQKVLQRDRVVRQRDDDGGGGTADGFCRGLVWYGRGTIIMMVVLQKVLQRDRVSCGRGMMMMVVVLQRVLFGVCHELNCSLRMTAGTS